MMQYEGLSTKNINNIIIVGAFKINGHGTISIDGAMGRIK